jgi:hypothetical protein
MEMRPESAMTSLFEFHMVEITKDGHEKERCEKGDADDGMVMIELFYR